MGKLDGREVLKQGADQLSAQGIPPQTAWLEASLLLGKAWQKDRVALLTSLDETPGPETRRAYRELLNRRLNQEPLQYILGEQVFMSLQFKVTPDVLIPRPETELLAQEAIALGRGLKDPMILDLCTGSGALAISLAYYLPQSRVTAVDISSPALEVARENACHNGVSKRVELLAGDLFSPLANRKFHLITCNPPYISEEEYGGLPAEVKKEPRLALYGGEDGLAFYRRIGSQAGEFLVEEGRLVMEIGYAQGPAVKEILATNGWGAIRLIKDWNGHDRVITAGIY